MDARDELKIDVDGWEEDKIRVKSVFQHPIQTPKKKKKMSSFDSLELKRALVHFYIIKII